METDDEYFCLTPGLSFATANPWSIIQGDIDYSFWNINTMQAVEAKVMLDIIFDQTKYKPQLLLPGVYMNSQYTQMCGFAFHIQRFHISTMSPVSEYFPSPCFKIEYLHPSLKITSRVSSGVDLQTLMDRFDPQVPLQYSSASPVESLRVAVQLGASLTFKGQELMFTGTYRDWYNRMIPSYNFTLAETLDVKEAISEVTIKNHVRLGDLLLTNIARGVYIWGEHNIPLRPRYTVIDTLLLQFHFATAELGIEYRPELDGIVTALPPLTLIHPAIGIRVRTITFFGTVINSTGITGDYYDGYPVLERAFAGGIRFKTTF
jgi:hypothetical protein